MLINNCIVGAKTNSAPKQPCSWNVFAEKFSEINDNINVTPQKGNRIEWIQLGQSKKSIKESYRESVVLF